jgi:hypothetical protein
MERERERKRKQPPSASRRKGAPLPAERQSLVARGLAVVVDGRACLLPRRATGREESASAVVHNSATCRVAVAKAVTKPRLDTDQISDGGPSDLGGTGQHNRIPGRQHVTPHFKSTPSQIPNDPSTRKRKTTDRREKIDYSLPLYADTTKKMFPQLQVSIILKEGDQDEEKICTDENYHSQPTSAEAPPPCGNDPSSKLYASVERG